MDVTKIINYLEDSFLADLLLKESITDISYNGEDIFYVDNRLGRKKRKTKVDAIQVKDFIRQIANLAEKQFSFQNPKLDVSFGKYRLSALHQSICRKNNNECVSFSLRIASSKLRIEENADTLPREVCELIDILIASNVSMAIGGLTGSGKTELQKYMIHQMKENTRTIVVDNILELDQIQATEDLDLNIWQIDENRQSASIQELVRMALRSNPDWLIVAEARGKEMLEVLNSALTGHPIITTLHALDIYSMPHRMARMVMMNEQKMAFEDVYEDISYHIRFYIYLKRKYQANGAVIRYISSIAYLNKEKMEEIYTNDGTKKTYKKLSKSALSLLEISEASLLFKRVFIGEKE